MGLRNLFKKTNVIRDLGKQRNQEVNSFFSNNPNKFIGPTSAYNSYNNNSAVSDAVETITTKLSEIKLIVKKDDGEIIREHKALDLLKTPNALQTYDEFMTEVSSNYLLNKNSYVELEGFIKSPPSKLYSVKNTDVNISEGSSRAIYQINATNFYSFLRRTFTLEPELGRIIDVTNLWELIHIKGFSLSSGSLSAVSKLQSVQKDIRILEQSDVRNLSFLTNGMSAAGILSVDTENQESFEQFKKDLKNRFTGANHSGEMIASKGKDVTFTKIDQSNKDMEVLGFKIDSKKTIYQLMQIPDAIKDKTAQTLDNYQTAQIALYDDAVLPPLRKILSSFTRLLKARKMLADDEELFYDDHQISALKLRRFSELEKLQKAEAITINEIRTVAGYEPLDENGDDVLVPVGKMPLGTEQVTQDNIDLPKKSFIELMKKNNMNDAEIMEHWNEHKATIRSLEES